MKKIALFSIVIIALLLIVGCQQKVVEEDKISEIEEKQESEPVEKTSTENSVVEETIKTVTYGSEIEILGKKGFDPSELSVSESSSINFVNNAPKPVVLIFKNGPRSSSSPTIKSGDSYEHVFEETGTYDYWTVGYGVKGKIVVE